MTALRTTLLCAIRAEINARATDGTLAWHRAERERHAERRALQALTHRSAGRIDRAVSDGVKRWCGTGPITPVMAAEILRRFDRRHPGLTPLPVSTVITPGIERIAGVTVRTGSDGASTVVL
jgi:hypothetical protein